VSVEIGSDLFEIISAFIGAEFSLSGTHSSEIEEMSLEVNCSPEPGGVLEWLPLWNNWYGVFEPSGQEGEAYTPVPRGNFRIRCGER
jgi:hypothetical protein